MNAWFGHFWRRAGSGSVARVLGVLSVAFLMLAATPPGMAVADEDNTATAATSDLQIPYGQMASIDDGALQLTFVAIDEDSRCPREVMCVWQGRAVIRVQAVLDGADQGEIPLTTTVLSGKGPANADVAVGRYTFRLVGMKPEASIDSKPGKDQYVALLRLTRS
jgi:hypothetical protein